MSQPLKLDEATNDVIQWASEKMKPVTTSPITTAILIVVIILLIVMLTWNGNRGVIRTAFWATVLTITILFIHDATLTKELKRDKDKENFVQYTQHPIVQKNMIPVVPGRVEGQHEKKTIVMPAMSFNRYDAQS